MDSSREIEKSERQFSQMYLFLWALFEMLVLGAQKELGAAVVRKKIGAQFSILVFLSIAFRLTQMMKLAENGI